VRPSPAALAGPGVGLVRITRAEAEALLWLLDELRRRRVGAPRHRRDAAAELANPYLPYVSTRERARAIAGLRTTLALILTGRGGL
jgi:hypothetical protein